MDKSDRRRHVRGRQQLEIEYSTAVPVRAQIFNLGEGGAFIVTSDLLPAGTALRYKFYLPGDPKPIEGEARVAWGQPNLGMGVEFQGLSQEDRERIRPFAAPVVKKSS